MTRDGIRARYKRMVKCLARLSAIKRRLLDDTEGSSYAVGGHIKLLHYQPAKLELARKRIKAFRKYLEEVQLQPVGFFLRSPRHFVTVAELLEWGRNTAVAVPRFVHNGMSDIVPVLESPVNIEYSSKK